MGYLMGSSGHSAVERLNSEQVIVLRETAHAHARVRESQIGD